MHSLRRSPTHPPLSACPLFSTPPRTQVMRRYHIQDRDDYKQYNRLVGQITKLTATLKRLDARDTMRIELTDQLLDK